MPHIGVGRSRLGLAEELPEIGPGPQAREQRLGQGEVGRQGAQRPRVVEVGGGIGEEERSVRPGLGGGRGLGSQPPEPPRSLVHGEAQMNMKGKLRLMWIAMGIGCLVAIWGTVDALRGESTLEVLVFTVPILVASLSAALLQLRYRWLGGTAPAAPDAAVVVRRIRHLRRVALVSAIAAITLATAVSILQSGAVWRALLIGVGAVALTCVIIVLIMRPPAQK